ncbi:hypothetical protein ACEPAI_757 [Sanghuangporus weigelae]
MTLDVPGGTIARENAALKIQRAWRSRNQKSGSLDTDERWQDAGLHAKMQSMRNDAEEGRNNPTERWKRATFLVSRLQADSTGSKNDTAEDSLKPEDEKILETQHWLELTDSKHRYGSNLKVGDDTSCCYLTHFWAFQYYHRKWLEEDTEENFFKWLDRGGGKDLSLPECSREQLEKERIIYLSPEQRLNYKVKVDEKGLLRWERSDELVDTTAGRWRDSGDGSGIVPFDNVASDTSVIHRTSFEIEPSRSRRSSTVSAGSQDSQNATHYVETSKKKNPIQRWLRRHLTVKGWTELLLRKTVRRNTWIYVADRQFNLYIGIKDTGTFQHSSFLAGGLVISAGLISVHKGLIHKLSPLSGHYRHASVILMHNRLLIILFYKNESRRLDERNVDLHRAEISRAELALWGIEHVKKFEKKKGEAQKRAKEKAKIVVDELTPSGEHGVWNTDSQWRRDILLGRKKSSGATGGDVGDESRVPEKRPAGVNGAQDSHDKEHS